MLSNTLNTNEIKNAAGTEQEFTRLGSGTLRETEFALINEAPALEHRLLIKHQETGLGIKRRRRSLIRFNKTVISTVDSISPVTISYMQILDAPVGALAANTEMANVIANGMSFVASLGASTTILYDCTGNGAVILLTGGI